MTIFLNIARKTLGRHPVNLTAFHPFAQRDQLIDPRWRDLHWSM